MTSITIEAVGYAHNYMLLEKFQFLYLLQQLFVLYIPTFHKYQAEARLHVGRYYTVK